MRSLADMGWIHVNVFKFAKKHKLKLTLSALKEARRFHKGQFRKDGREAFVHPYRVCQILIFYGVWDDVILAASLLHDVLEDVKGEDKKAAAMKRIVERFPEAVVSLVVILTKYGEMSAMEYCLQIGNKIGAVLIKLADRLHNLRNMIRRLGSNSFFTDNRLREQIQETSDCIVKLSHWVEMRELIFPSNNQKRHFRIAREMTVELEKTVHVGQVVLSGLEV